jgi:hypothetical protein
MRSARLPLAVGRTTDSVPFDSHEHSICVTNERYFTYFLTSLRMLMEVLKSRASDGEDEKLRCMMQDVLSITDIITIHEQNDHITENKDTGSSNVMNSTHFEVSDTYASDSDLEALDDDSEETMSPAPPPYTSDEHVDRAVTETVPYLENNAASASQHYTGPCMAGSTTPGSGLKCRCTSCSLHNRCHPQASKAPPRYDLFLHSPFTPVRRPTYFPMALQLALTIQSISSLLIHITLQAPLSSQASLRHPDPHNVSQPINTGGSTFRMPRPSDMGANAHCHTCGRATPPGRYFCAGVCPTMIPSDPQPLSTTIRQISGMGQAAALLMQHPSDCTAHPGLPDSSAAPLHHRRPSDPETLGVEAKLLEKIMRG